MPDPNRSPNSDNEKRKAEVTEKENEKEIETGGEMHVDPRPVTHEVPTDIEMDFFEVSDGDNDSNFGSEYDDMAEEIEENQVEENLNQIDLDDGEPANTTGTNSPHFPSVPSSPVVHPTPERGLTGTVIRRSLVPPSSTITIPPAQTRGLPGSNLPHPLVPSPIFPIPSTQTRSSTGSDTSRPLARPSGPTVATIAAPSQVKGSTPSSSRLPPAGRGVGPWQMSLQSLEPRGPPPLYTPSAQSLCVVRNSRITSFVFISSLSVNAGLQRETGL